jgi:hypothetical protein
MENGGFFIFGDTPGPPARRILHFFFIVIKRADNEKAISDEGVD